MMLNNVDTLVLESLGRGAEVSLLVGVVLACSLLAKSLVDFTRTGPQMTEEILSYYRLYLVGSLARLWFYTFLIASFMAFAGVVAYVAGLVLCNGAYQSFCGVGAGVLAIGTLSARQFLRTLLYSPGVIASSSLYSMTHFYALWQRLSPKRLRRFDTVLFGTVSSWLMAAVAVMASNHSWGAVAIFGLILCGYVALLLLATWWHEPNPVSSPGQLPSPNILMIGSDTLRADRLNGAGYPRDLAPNLARLAQRATQFTHCYVPCARTAPSLASMLTGTWPHTHGVRDTFVTPQDTRLPVPAITDILRQAGYQTAIVGDWAASDVSKLSFNFEHTDVSQDQWNIKYLLRQGPKDIRLFLSLFTQNRLGKAFLPEIYHLGGIPLTEEVGRDTRAMVAKLAARNAPFFLMSFMATNHPPFTSKYPYYAMFSDRNYRGESKFAMAKLRDPFEIIRRQGEPKTEFDLDQIIDLYDGCVKNFDDEVARILRYLELSKLAENTIVVIFSDHGMEFFEHETWGQGNSAIGDFSARVPLIIADPGEPSGKTVSDVVRTVDLASTLLELVDLPVPDYMEGVSLAPYIRGEALHTQLPAFYETGVWLTDLPGTPQKHLRYPSLPDLLEVPDKKLGMICLKPQYLALIMAAKDRMIRLGDWKLTYQPLTDGPLYQLFNIREDPGCTRNVLEEHRHIAEGLKAMLLDWINDKRAKYPAPIRATDSRRAAASFSDSRFPQPKTQ